MKYLNWMVGGFLLGIVFFLAVLLVKPIGVSTQFVVLDGVVMSALDPELVVESAEATSGWTSPNAYLDASGGKLAAHVARPLNYDFLFVLAMAVGAFVSRQLAGGLAKGERFSTRLWRANVPGWALSRFVAAFAGGFIVLFGARLADGCTSGHMMSGMMQTATSGYIFALGAFASAIPLASWLYRKEA